MGLYVLIDLFQKFSNNYFQKRITFYIQIHFIYQNLHVKFFQIFFACLLSDSVTASVTKLLQKSCLTGEKGSFKGSQHALT